MTTEPYFGPELFAFLRALGENNNREWFQANKKRFERDVRDPMLRFITDFGPHLDRISTRFVADPRPNGGSLLLESIATYAFPKTSAPTRPTLARTSATRPVRTRTRRASTFTSRAGEVFAGSGIWHPDAPALTKIRDAIVDDPKGWRRATSAKVLGAGGTLSGESLKRPPRGYDPRSPAHRGPQAQGFFRRHALRRGRGVWPRGHEEHRRDLPKVCAADRVPDQIARPPLVIGGGPPCAGPISSE